MKRKKIKVKLIPKKLVMVDGLLAGLIFDMTDETETQGVYTNENPFFEVKFEIEKKDGYYIGKQTSPQLNKVIHISAIK